MSSKAVSEVFGSVALALKWRRYRNAIFDLYKATNDLDGYKKSIGLHQLVVKGYMQKHNKKVLDAIIELCEKEKDPKVQVRFIAGGYDLINGQDYTNQLENKHGKK
jgi:hypothetical protein